MAELAEPVTVPESTIIREALSASLWRARLNVRAWPVARQFLLALVVVYLAKQAINVIVFPPFTGHDEVAHYAYLRTVASDHRVPVLPDLTNCPPPGVDYPTPPPGDYTERSLPILTLHSWLAGNPRL
jgi:hypothetical protein